MATPPDDRVEELRRRTGAPLSAERAREALTHKSWANEYGPPGVRADNERFEFLGDAVIDLAISHRLMERFPGASEGDLSRARAVVVSEAGLASVARALGLGDLLWLGKGEERSGGRTRSSVLANALEAVIGAIYLDGGMEAALAFVDRHFIEILGLSGPGMHERDYKTAVQELAQGALRITPRYHVVSVQGPEHGREYTVAVVIGEKTYGEGSGRSKKEAEQAAAGRALPLLQSEIAGP